MRSYDAQPGLDTTKERWKHELELEILLGSAEYREMFAKLNEADKRLLTERIEAANSIGQGGGAAEAVWFVEQAIMFKSQHPDNTFDEVDENFQLPQPAEMEEGEQEQEESAGDVNVSTSDGLDNGQMNSTDPYQ